MGLGLWRNCSNWEHRSEANPLGLSKRLLEDGPIAVVNEEFRPALDHAFHVTGRRFHFLPWMWEGQYVEAGVMAADSHSRLIESGTGRPWEYGTAYRLLQVSAATVYAYHGSPRRGRLSYEWLAPIIECPGVVPVFDAEGDRTSAMMLDLSQILERLKIRYEVEPFIGPQTYWASRAIGCFVLLKKVREVIRKAWAPATGAARDYASVSVLVPDVEDIDLDECNGYLRRGWNVFLPLDTPEQTLRAFADNPPEVAAA